MKDKIIKKKVTQKPDAETEERLERIRKSKKPTEQFFVEISNILK